MHYALFHMLGLDTGTLPEGPTTPDLEWPTWVVYSAVPLGSSLMCFRFLQVMVSFIKTGELPHHDHGHVEGVEEKKVPLEEKRLELRAVLQDDENGQTGNKNKEDAQ
jgi:C4-dicarboxylate transporter DctQ subunit